MKTHITELFNKLQQEMPSFKVEQVFSGYIQEVQDGIAYVVLIDESHDEEDMIGEIELCHFPEGVKEPGTIFYWYIGDNNDEPYSLIRLNEVRWTQEQIDKAKKEGEELFKAFMEHKTLEE